MTKGDFYCNETGQECQHDCLCCNDGLNYDQCNDSLDKLVDWLIDTNFGLLDEEDDEDIW